MRNSIPLLLARTAPGLGPLVPLRQRYDRLVVEGPGIVRLRINSSTLVLGEGKHEIEPTENGDIAQAELLRVAQTAEAIVPIHVRLELQ